MENTNFKVNTGKNLLIIHQAQQLPNGTYLLTVSVGNNTETIKVVKQ